MAASPTDTGRRRATRRVRDALWRMRTPDDMADLLAAIRQGVLDMGAPLQYCSVNVVDDSRDPPEVTMHSMSRDGGWKRMQAVGASTVVGASPRQV